MLVVLHQGGGHGHSHGGTSQPDKKKKKKGGNNSSICNGKTKKKKLRDNINVTAASIHVIGDFLQTIGVLITSYIVWFRVSFMELLPHHM